MATTLRYDADAAARLVAIYLTPDMVAQRAAVLRALVPNAGDRVLDVGSGPGLLAAAIAERVGAAGRVLGVDISAPLLAYARMHFAALPWLRFVRADAARLPCADASFDTIVCMQVLKYLPDAEAALAEFARVLRPGGQLLAIDTDWGSLVWASGDRARMARACSRCGTSTFPIRTCRACSARTSSAPASSACACASCRCSTRRSIPTPTAIG